MNIQRRLLVLSIVCALGICRALQAQTTETELKAGTWAGTLDMGKDIRLVHINFASADGVLTGEARNPEAPGEPPLQLKNVQLKENEITFEIPPDLICSGHIYAGTLSSDKSTPCRLNLVATKPYPEQEKIVGAFRISGGQAFAISSLADFPQLTICVYQSGAWRNLFHRGKGQFTAGAGISAPLPVAYSIEVVDSDALKIREGSGRPLIATRVLFREKNLAWTNGEAQLAGTLILPQGKGPFPAIVLTQMSSDAPRDAYRMYAYFFAAHGLAALIYDRRGLGESKGDTANTGMIELANDAVEAVHALQKLPEIDGKRIGTWGHSQGGWIAPLAAAQSADVAFVIAQSGPAVTAAEQEIFRVETSARNSGLSEAEVEAAVKYERLLMQWVKTGEGRDEIHAISKQSANEPWARFVELREDLPEKPTDRSQKFWYLDPAPEFAKVRVPILAIFGSRDAFVPVDKSIPILKESLAKAGNQDVTVVVLPDAAHGLWATKIDSFRELTTSPGFHKDYWLTLLDWLKKHKLGS